MQHVVILGGGLGGLYAAKALSGHAKFTRHWTCGRRAGDVADFGRLHFHGWPAWLLWLFVHLMCLTRFRNRVLVFIRWGFQYLTFDRGARLITGA